MLPSTGVVSAPGAAEERGPGNTTRNVGSGGGLSAAAWNRHEIRPRRASLDRHATYIVAAYLAGAAR
jgi:hypothetical protein